MKPATDPPPPVSFRARVDVPAEGARVGEHVRLTVFAGPDADHRAHCGVLVLRAPEAQALQERLTDPDPTYQRLRAALAEGAGTHDCPACNRGGPTVGVLQDGTACPLCEGWGSL